MATLREIIDAGGARYVFNLRRQGRDFAYILRAIQARWPGTNNQVAQQAIARGDNALAGGAMHRQLAPGQRVPAGGLMRALGGGTGWRYNVAVHWDDGQGGPRQTTVVTMRFAQSQTQQDLENLITVQLLQAARNRGRIYGSKEVEQNAVFRAATVLTIERVG